MGSNRLLKGKDIARIWPIAKLAADTASLKNLQANHHANGGFTHDR
jgi:hypothetical protein